LVQLNVPWAYDYALHGALEPVDETAGRISGDVHRRRACRSDFNGKVYGFPHYKQRQRDGLQTKPCSSARASTVRRPPLIEQLAAARSFGRNRPGGFRAGARQDRGHFLEEGLPLIDAGRAQCSIRRRTFALIARFADAYKAGGLLKDKLFSEDNYPASIDAYKSGRLANDGRAASALIRVRDDAPDIYRITEAAPAPMGANDDGASGSAKGRHVAAGGWLFHFAMPRGTRGEVAVEAGPVRVVLDQ